ncbi:MAG TPA: hypothetical protein DEB40_01275 [Elusimicrobia bacterium]|nr:hypothetical protein [Elusimicrobiota bacterium]HBT60361.1 hypothetical protein [Elusimicrobiota bacterium]
MKIGPLMIAAMIASSPVIASAASFNWQQPIRQKVKDFSTLLSRSAISQGLGLSHRVSRREDLRTLVTALVQEAKGNCERVAVVSIPPEPASHAEIACFADTYPSATLRLNNTPFRGIEKTNVLGTYLLIYKPLIKNAKTLPDLRTNGAIVTQEEMTDLARKLAPEIRRQILEQARL